MHEISYENDLIKIRSKMQECCHLMGKIRSNCMHKDNPEIHIRITKLLKLTSPNAMNRGIAKG